MKKSRSIFPIIAAALFLVFLQNTALAQITNPLKATSLTDFLTSVANQAMIFGAIIAVLFFVYSGFLFVAARGNTEKLEHARRTFFYTVIGTAILLGATVISAIIQGTVTKLQSNSATDFYLSLKNLAKITLG